MAGFLTGSGRKFFESRDMTYAGHSVTGRSRCLYFLVKDDDLLGFAWKCLCLEFHVNILQLLDYSATACPLRPMLISDYYCTVTSSWSWVFESPPPPSLFSSLHFLRPFLCIWPSKLLSFPRFKRKNAKCGFSGMLLSFLVFSVNWNGCRCDLSFQIDT